MKTIATVRWMDTARAIEETQRLLDEQDVRIDCRNAYDLLGDLLPRDQILRFLAVIDARLRPMGLAVVILPPNPSEDLHRWRIDVPENCVDEELFPCDRLDD